MEHKGLYICVNLVEGVHLKKGDIIKVKRRINGYSYEVEGVNFKYEYHGTMGQEYLNENFEPFKATKMAKLLYL